VAVVPLHLHPMRDELLARAPELAKAVLERSARDGKVWDLVLDVEACVAVFRTLAEQEDVGGLRCAIVNDSHLFAYSVTAFWFMPSVPVLAEQFLLRVGRGSSDAAMDAIEMLGREAGCKFSLMATSLAANDEALGRLYARRGYSPQSSQHLKAL
jgi:hypothetical protein